MTMFSAEQIAKLVDSGEVPLSTLMQAVFLALDYKVRTFPFGNDGSVEMVVDGKVGPFGFVLPQIAVLVKSGPELADPSDLELETFLGGSGAWQALFVSPRGFSARSRKEAGRLFLQAIFWELPNVIEAAEAIRDRLPNHIADLS